MAARAPVPQGLFAAGQVGRDADMNVIDSSLEDHIVAAWENVSKVLAAAGASYEDIVEMTTFHVDLQEQLPLFLQIKNRYIPHIDRARSALAPAGLGRGPPDVTPRRPTDP